MLGFAAALRRLALSLRLAACAAAHAGADLDAVKRRGVVRCVEKGTTHQTRLPACFSLRGWAVKLLVISALYALALFWLTRRG